MMIYNESSTGNCDDYSMEIESSGGLEGQEIDSGHSSEIDVSMEVVSVVSSEKKAANQAISNSVAENSSVVSKSSTKSVNRFGKKLIKATTKIFSPTKKTANSPTKSCLPNVNEENKMDETSRQPETKTNSVSVPRKRGSQIGMMPSSAIKSIESTMATQSQNATSSYQSTMNQKAQHIITIVNKNNSAGSMSTLGTNSVTSFISGSTKCSTEPSSTQKLRAKKEALAEGR